MQLSEDFKSSPNIFLRFFTTHSFPIRIFYNKTPFKSNVANVKYIIKPVTSTNVDTNGADELAGSAPSLRNKNGSMEPVNDPHNTTQTKEKLITNPIKIQYSP